MTTGYQVIARRWRPRQFNQLVGQDHIVRTLGNAIRQNRIAHAYLFVGPRGTGKTSTARLFATALNCENGPSLEIPENSEISAAIQSDSCMDVIEIDGASNNSVEQVRDLREDCQYAPSQCRYKIYIIDEVHMLSVAAFNALLKTLEEPPPHVKFIFATTESHKVPATILSRCQRFEFRPLAQKTIADKLEFIAKAEKIDIDYPALLSIANMANGGMRDAQSILDQMIAFCGGKISEKDILDVYGLASPGIIKTIAQGIASADYGSVIKAVDSLADEGRDLYRVLVDLQSYFREALMENIRTNSSEGLLGVLLSTESIMRILDTLHSSEDAVKKGLSEKVNFEIALLKSIDQSRRRPIDTLIKQLSTGLPQEPGKKKIEELSSQELQDLSLRSYLEKFAGCAEYPVDDQEEGVIQSLPIESPCALQVPPSSSDSEELVPSNPFEQKKPALDLEQAIAKIPPETRQLFENLFRGNFVSVSEVQKDKII